MKSRAALAFAVLTLGGCGRTLYVTGRTNGITGQTTVTPILGHPSGDMTLTLGAKTYARRWVYVSGPGSVSVVSTTAFSGTQSASALGTGIGMPTSGHGSIVMSAPGGGSFRCVFDYSQWSNSGVGECQDEAGELYDLQITR